MKAFKIVRNDKIELLWDDELKSQIVYHHPMLENTIDSIRKNAEVFVNVSLTVKNSDFEIYLKISESLNKELSYNNLYTQRFIQFGAFYGLF